VGFEYRYPDEGLKEKYKLINYLLLGILGILILLRIFVIYIIINTLITRAFYTDIVMFAPLLYSIVILIVMIWFFKLLKNFDIRVYLYLPIFLVLVFWFSGDVLSIIIAFVILALSLFLKKKLFPNIPINKISTGQKMDNKIKIIIIACVVVAVIFFGVYLYLSNIVMQTFGTGGDIAPIVNDCIFKCREKLNAGINLENGPCISNNIASGWVCDVVHSPRSPADDLPENQCSEYGKTAAHFVEVDINCNYVFSR
jgi:hypothetical protein